MSKKILIIEDEVILLNLLRKKLINQGYDVFVAQDGDVGIKKIREVMPDLILLDIVMPKIDGYEVLEEVKKDDELKSIPVIIISNSGQPVEIERIKELGAIDWLIKTEFDPQEIVDKVVKVIGQ